MINLDSNIMKAKRKTSKKIKKNSPFNLTLFVILIISVILSVIAVAKSDSSIFELRKRADEITPTATPTPKNVVPTCLGLSVSPLIGKTPLELTLSCAGVDGNNDITAAEFGLGGNYANKTVEKGVGQYGTIVTTMRYDKSGSYVVTCRVRDNNNEWSNIPSNCSNTVNVSLAETVVIKPKVTPTPIYEEPTPTQILESPTPTVTIAPLPTITPSPTPTKSAVSQETMFTIGKILLISIVTIMVGLLLKKLIDGNE